jgi:hypothetical protein
MARVRWSVRCTTTRSRDGQPCAAWSVRGGFVCRCHGGSVPRVRALADQRLPYAKLLDRDVPDWRDDLEKWRHLLTPGRSWHGPRPV